MLIPGRDPLTTWLAKARASRGGHPALPVIAFADTDRADRTLWHAWAFGLPAGTAALGLVTDNPATGYRLAQGNTVQDMLLDSPAVGYRLAQGSAVQGVLLDNPAVGLQPAVLPAAGYAVWGLTLDHHGAAFAERRRGIHVVFPGDHPLDLAGETLAGYHRPLDGESANLTVTAAPQSFFPAWLTSPPLGTPCQVLYEGETVLDGALYGVKVTAKAVELRVEG
ncbi:MAG: hypothetical protein WAU60_03220 [Candidatus Competibacter denitrificans]|jgi:hypothetical protein